MHFFLNSRIGMLLYVWPLSICISDTDHPYVTVNICLLHKVYDKNNERMKDVSYQGMFHANGLITKSSIWWLKKKSLEVLCTILESTEENQKTRDGGNKSPMEPTSLRSVSMMRCFCCENLH